MVADLFHYGHVNALKQAKSLGDYLIVGIHSDETVKSYKRTPIMTMAERIAVIEGCKYVDEIIQDAPLKISVSYLKLHNIDIVCIQDNRSEKDCKLMYDIPNKLGIIKTHKYTTTICDYI